MSWEDGNISRITFKKILEEANCISYRTNTFGESYG